jgi:high-affinity iron transporter
VTAAVRTVRRSAIVAAVLSCAWLAPAAAQDGAAGTFSAVDAGLVPALDRIRAALAEVGAAARSGDAATAVRLGVRAYLDQYESVEAVYGFGGPRSHAALSNLVTATESEFHALMRGGDAATLQHLTDTLLVRIDRIEQIARASGIALGPLEAGAIAAVAAPRAAPARAAGAATEEVRWILADITRARAAFDAGRPAEALAAVEHAYLEGFEPLESRLPPSNVHTIESLIHLRLRPQLARGAPPAAVAASFTTLERELGVADAALAAGGSSWFGVFNAFVIIVREGLEAVLLIAAILAYLSAIKAAPVHRRRVFVGAGAGVAASFSTWILARTLLPVSGANRELIEGVTALVAVGVLLYVSHWLFQKTYIHDWKHYLRTQVGRAVSGGSAFAMAGLAFAAVFREGFETVLFYQALLYDFGPGAVAGGFVPGFALILVVGTLIVKLGVRLPLRIVFGATNVILLYLAFVFLGKGLYNLQEAGLFSPAPIHWLPDTEALRQILGFYPVAQTVLAQVALLLMLVTGWLVYRLRGSFAPRIATPAK